VGAVCGAGVHADVPLFEESGLARLVRGGGGSFVVLVMGAKASGKSWTLYGDGRTDQGLVLETVKQLLTQQQQQPATGSALSRLEMSAVSFSNLNNTFSDCLTSQRLVLDRDEVFGVVARTRDGQDVRVAVNSVSHAREVLRKAAVTESMSTSRHVVVTLFAAGRTKIRFVELAPRQRSTALMGARSSEKKTRDIVSVNTSITAVQSVLVRQNHNPNYRKHPFTHLLEDVMDVHGPNRPLPGILLATISQVSQLLVVVVFDCVVVCFSYVQFRPSSLPRSFSIPY